MMDVAKAEAKLHAGALRWIRERKGTPVLTPLKEVK